MKRSILLRVLIIAFCAYMLISLGTPVDELSSRREELSETQSQIKDKTLSVEEKENLIKNSTLEEFIERAAREMLGFVYPNEQVFVDIN